VQADQRVAVQGRSQDQVSGEDLGVRVGVIGQMMKLRVNLSEPRGRGHDE
jgi:hypothetical protein